MPVRSIKPRVRPGHESGCALLLRSGKSRHPKPWRPCSATLSRPSPSLPWKASSGRLFAPPPYWSAPIANYDASSGKHAVSPVSAEPKWPSTYRPSGSMLVGPRRRRLGGRLPVRSFLTGSICTLSKGYATGRAARGEFSFDIPNPKLLSCQHAPQYGIHVAKRESTDKQVCLFPGTELRLWLDFVPEVPVVGSAQDDHALCGPSSFE